MLRKTVVFKLKDDDASEEFRFLMPYIFVRCFSLHFCLSLFFFWVTEFIVVHNGIITNYKGIKTFLISKGKRFESETDTEIIAVLIKYLYDNREDDKVTFRELVENVIQQLVSTTLAVSCYFIK